MSSDVVALLQRLIRNACVNTGAADSGHEHRSVTTLQDFFDVPGKVFEPSPGRQSLVYRIPGTDPMAPSLALVPHLDVVPVDEDGWSQDPFGADIVDGFVYGRGAVDMLNLTTAFAHAVRPYITGDLEPKGDLVFVAVADEEGGGRYGARHLVSEHWDLVGADFVLTEVAYPPVPLGQSQAIPVAVGEKGSFFSRLKTTGTPGHGSAPYGADNAFVKMAGAIAQLVEAPSPVEISDQWMAFVEGLELDPATSRALIDPDAVDRAIDALATSDPVLAGYIHAATHLTVSPNQAMAGTGSNIIPDQAKTILDIRSLPGMDWSFVATHLTETMRGVEIDLKSLGDNTATISPSEGFLWEAIAEAVDQLEGHKRLLPTLMTVATDARFWRRRGSTAYGVGLFDDRSDFSGMLSLFHGHDERISIESVERTTALYKRILRQFAL